MSSATAFGFCSTGNIWRHLPCLNNFFYPWFHPKNFLAIGHTLGLIQSVTNITTEGLDRTTRCLVQSGDKQPISLAIAANHEIVAADFAEVRLHVKSDRPRIMFPHT